MKSHWNKKIANQYIKKYAKIKISKDLALRIYTTHLLGSEKKLVLHGGGNTSLKETFLNFDDDYEILPGHGPSGKVRSIKDNNEFIKVLLND